MQMFDSLRISHCCLPQSTSKIAATLISNIVNEGQNRLLIIFLSALVHTEVLAQFWIQCGFQIVRLRVHKEAAVDVMPQWRFIH